MSVLTHEVAKALRDRVNANDPLELIRATEQAVLSKLAAGVSVEPAYYWEPDGTIEWMKDGSGFSTNTGPAHGWKITHYYTAEQLASARVQTATEIMELPQIKGNLFAEKAIRALIGGAK